MMFARNFAFHVTWHLQTTVLWYNMSLSWRNRFAVSMSWVDQYPWDKPAWLWSSSCCMRLGQLGPCVAPQPDVEETISPKLLCGRACTVIKRSLTWYIPPSDGQFYAVLKHLVGLALEIAGGCWRSYRLLSFPLVEFLQFDLVDCHRGFV